mmetsp:Transcript_20916/g.30119  ORF Transcript_20916/g.30119 Transcript_20916/m.30119 type:complete len:379 (+) Transcript_20916:42-1178(+)
MSDISRYFAGLVSRSQGSHEEQLISSLLYNESVDVSLGDRRLNSIAALTYNSAQCERIFSMLEKSLVPEHNPWQTLYKAVLLLHTIVLYGSEKAVDCAINICHLIHKLQDYNSALVKKPSFLFSSGGRDYGAPVRESARRVESILRSDDEIRQARAQARDDNSLVPLGHSEAPATAAPAPVTFGQGGAGNSMGAGFDLTAVPGMYEGRPDRYFDDSNDFRRGATVGDHQFTREAMNTECLLDLAFAPSSQESSLPPADYLPALERQKELERQLAEQQEQLRRLQALASGQGNMQQQFQHQPQPPSSQAVPPYQQAYPYQHQQQYNQQFQYQQQYNQQAPVPQMQWGAPADPNALPIPPNQSNGNAPSYSNSFPSNQYN